MKTNANEGMGKVFWSMAITIVIFLVLGGVLWWYDAYWIHE